MFLATRLVKSLLSKVRHHFVWPSSRRQIVYGCDAINKDASPELSQ
uniref:Uncharacterized protein n=1 Tax=Anguilla anguilla TaxID=7936 RepID=A0A0E9WEQ7_ANGAN